MKQEFSDVQAGYIKGRGQEIKLTTSIGSSKKRENSRKTSTSTYWLLQSLYCVDHNKLWEILKDMGIPDHLTCLLKNLYAGEEQQLEPDMGQWTGSKLGKE